MPDQEMPSPAALFELLQTDPAAAHAVIFRGYVEQLIRGAAAHLCKKPKVHPGTEAIVQSAFASFFLNHVPPAEVVADPEGLWRPLLDITIRHCDKWNSYYRTKKRSAPVASLGASDVADRRSGPEEEVFLADLYQRLEAMLTPRQQELAILLMQGRHTTAELAGRFNVSHATIVREKRALRTQLDKLTRA